MKRLLHAGVAAIVVAIIAAVIARTGVLGDSVQVVTLSIVAPVVDALGYPVRALEGGWSLLAGNRRLRNDNMALQRRCDALALELERAKDSVERIRELEEFLKLRDVEPEMEVARIVARDELAWRRTLLINRGVRDGLMRNMAVVAGRGLIGKVASVGHAYARVVLLTDPGSRAGARLRQSCSTGVAEGNGAALLALKYLPRDTPIAAGEDVITSGLGGVFPAGYLIGTVRDVISGEGGFYQTAMVTPAVDVARLEYVIVLKRAPPLIDDGSEGGE